MTEQPIEQRTNPPTRFLRRPEVTARTGLSRSTIQVRLAEGHFPRPVSLGSRAVGWIEPVTTGARLMAALECANDAGGRCALWPSGDARRCCGVGHDTATSCAYAARPAGTAGAALTGTGATPQSKGLVRARGEVCFHISPRALQGSLLANHPFAGRRFSAASRRRITRSPAARPSGWRASSSKAEPPMARDATPRPGRPMAFPVGIVGGGATHRRRETLTCTCRISPMPIKASRRGGSLPSTAASSGTASPLRRPWCNRKAARDIRKRRRAHRSGVTVHMHSIVGCALAGRRPGSVSGGVSEQPSMIAPGLRIGRHPARLRAPEAFPSGPGGAPQ